MHVLTGRSSLILRPQVSFKCSIIILGPRLSVPATDPKYQICRFLEQEELYPGNCCTRVLGLASREGMQTLVNIYPHTVSRLTEVPLNLL